MAKVPQTLRQMSNNKHEAVKRNNTYGVLLSAIQIVKGHNVRNAIDPNYWESDKAKNRIDAITEYIEEGIYVPPVDVWVEDGVIKLHDGEHRYYAYKQYCERNGIEPDQLSIIVNEVSGNDVKLGFAMIASNQSEPWTPCQLARLYARQLNLGVTLTDLALKINRTTTTINNYLKLNDLPLEMQLKVDSGEISMSAALDSFDNIGTKAKSKSGLVSNAKAGRLLASVLRKEIGSNSIVEHDGKHYLELSDASLEAYKKFIEHFGE